MNALTAKSNNIDHEAILLALKQQLSQINHLLRSEQRGRKRRQLKQRAWILLLGPNSSGKTALINAADLAITDKLTQDNPHCNTWVTDQAVYIELPAAVIEAESNIWHKTWRILTKAHQGKPLDNILLTLNCADLVNAENLAAQLNFLARIKTLTATLKPARSISCVFTHLDDIAGFNSFFQDLSDEDRKQVFGFDWSSELNGKLVWPQQCRHHLQALMDRLHEQLVWRLEKISQQSERALCYEFPLQLESLTNLMLQCLQKLLDPNTSQPYLPIIGVYFACNTQTSEIFDRLAGPMADNFDIQASYSSSHVCQAQAYFSYDLLQTRLPALTRREPEIAQKPLPKKVLYKAAVTLVLCLSLAGTWQLTREFNHSLSALNQTQLALQQLAYAPTTPAKPMVNVALLRQATLAASTVKQLPMAHYLLPAIKHLQKSLNAQYRLSLRQTYFKQLLASLTQTLGTSTDPMQRYNGLKVYLMLADPAKFNSAAVKNWFTHTWQHQTQLSPIERNIKQNLLTDLLQQDLAPINVNTDLVHKVRQQLKSLPPALLFYLALKANQPHSQKAIANNTAAFTYSGQRHAIPALYTQAVYQHWLSKPLAHISDLTQQNWVLGATLDEETRSLKPELLTQQLRTLYLADYANWWHLFLFNSQPVVFRDLKQADQSLGILAGPQSPLVQFLQTVKTNTQRLQNDTPGAEQFNQQIAKPFAAVNQLSADYFIQLRQHLTALRDWVHSISIRSDTDKAAFQLAKYIYANPKADNPIASLLNFAAQSPQPLQRWLKAIAVNSWYLVLHKTVAYLNQQWQQKVWPQYSVSIAGRYPIDPSASDEITLKNFTAFFAVGGTLDTFVKTELQPFLDTQHANWQAKKRYHLQLPFDKAAINQFIRAHLIQEMFFPEHNQNLFVHFKLKPLSLEPIVHTVKLDFYGQKSTTTQITQKSQDFIWPAKAAKHQRVKLTFTDITGHSQQLQLNGDWGWLRLFQQANLKPFPHSTQQYQLVFNLKGDAARYQLTTDAVINPFIPGILPRFALPRVLL